MLKPLCQTRWTVRTKAIDAVLKNYNLLQDTLDIIKQGKDEHTMKAVGFLNSMDKFSTYFGLQLSHLIFSATEQLSITLQGKETSLQQAVEASKLTLHYVERQRSDSAYDLLYSSVVSTSSGLTSQPTLPRQRKCPKKIDSTSIAHMFENPKSYYRRQYFEVLDVVVNAIKSKFHQERGMP